MIGFLFDFNGTLVFDGPLHDIAWAECARDKFGINLSKETTAKYIHGCPNVEAIETLCPGRFTMEQKEEISRYKEAMYRKAVVEQDLKLVDGAEEFLDCLKTRGIPFTIASASIKENIDFFVEHFHLDRWIDPSTIVYDNGQYKNKVEMFKDAAHLLNVPIEDCYVLEDSQSGIRSALTAGCKSILNFGRPCEHTDRILLNASNYHDVLNWFHSNIQ